MRIDILRFERIQYSKETPVKFGQPYCVGGTIGIDQFRMFLVSMAMILKNSMSFGAITSLLSL